MQTPCKPHANPGLHHANPMQARCNRACNTQICCMMQARGCMMQARGRPSTSHRLMPSVNVTRDTRITARMCSPPRAHFELELLHHARACQSARSISSSIRHGWCGLWISKAIDDVMSFGLHGIAWGLHDSSLGLASGLAILKSRAWRACMVFA